MKGGEIQLSDPSLSDLIVVQKMHYSEKGLFFGVSFVTAQGNFQGLRHVKYAIIANVVSLERL